jgi:hypothetical protein
MENYQCHITINNRTTSHLRLAKRELQWGKFRDGNSPVEDIPPRSERKSFIAQGKFGPAGVEGTVTYQYQDDANLTLVIYFDIPTRPLSENTIRATTSDPDLGASVEGFIGKGSTESCTIKLVDGR